jgi:hypothetical protein
MRLFDERTVRWAESQPHFADLLETGEGRLLDALEILDAVAVEVVAGGWGGLCVRAVTVDGVSLAVKVPAEVADRTAAAEVGALRVLHAAGVGPAPVGWGEGWLALPWLEGKPLSGKRHRTGTLDVSQLADIVAAISAIETQGFERRDGVLALRVTVGSGSSGALLDVGVDPARLNVVNVERCVALTSLGPQGFCHGDFDPANIVDVFGRYVVIDPQARVGPVEAEVGWFVGSAACGRQSSQVDRLRQAMCRAVGGDVDRVREWEDLYAASWLCELWENSPERVDEIASLSRRVRQLQ